MAAYTTQTELLIMLAIQSANLITHLTLQHSFSIKCCAQLGNGFSIKSQLMSNTVNAGSKKTAIPKVISTLYIYSKCIII